MRTILDLTGHTRGGDMRYRPGGERRKTHRVGPLIRVAHRLASCELCRRAFLIVDAPGAGICERRDCLLAAIRLRQGPQLTLVRLGRVT